MWRAAIVSFVRLPNAERAVVSREKILGYLLAPGHRTGGPKHAFFTAHGFARERWEALAEALRRHGLAHEAIPEETAFGVRYRIDGPLDTPDGRRPWCRAVWFVESGAVAPRLVTAYPLSRRG